MKLIDNIIAEHHDDLAFLIGNGINHMILETKDQLSWNGMLIGIWEKIHGKDSFPFTHKENNNLPENKNNGNNENNGNNGDQFAMLEIGELTKGKFVDVKKDVCDKLKRQKPSKHSPLLVKLQNHNIPILTTNYDLNMEILLGLERFEMPGLNKGDGFTPFYPWNLYYSHKKLQSPTDGFAIWHIHGICSYPQSIAFSTMDYVDMIKRAYKRIGNAVNIFNLKGQNGFDLGENTWLKLFFEKSLCIVGLGMSQNEIFLRWLLIQRKLYYWVKQHKIKPIYFLCHENETLTAYDKDFFNLVGVEIRNFKDFDAIYN